MLPFCGPTVYHLSGVTASVRIEEAWNATRAEEGLRAAGFTPGPSTPSSVHGRNGSVSMGADGGGTSGPFRVYYSAPTEDVQGSRAEVERAADEHITRHEPDARAAIEAFARGAGWTFEPPIAWDKGMLHGDC